MKKGRKAKRVGDRSTVEEIKLKKQYDKKLEQIKKKSIEKEAKLKEKLELQAWESKSKIKSKLTKSKSELRKNKDIYTLTQCRRISFLKYQRIIRGLSINEVSICTNISHSMLHTMEKYPSEKLDLDSIKKILNFYNVPHTTYFNFLWHEDKKLIDYQKYLLWMKKKSKENPEVMLEDEEKRTDQLTEDWNISLGRKIKALRRSKGDFLFDLAEVIQVSSNTVMELEKGNGQIIKYLKKLYDISNYFDVPIEYLLQDNNGSHSDSYIAKKYNKMKKSDKEKVSQFFDYIVNRGNY